MFDLKEKSLQAGFSLRNCLRFSRKGFQESHEDKLDLWSGKPCRAEAEAHLLQSYPLLVALKNQSTQERYLENLNLMEALDTMARQTGFDFPEIALVDCLEIGAKNWSTVDALLSFLSTRLNKPYSLTGIELDPWRLYANGHSRYDLARAYSKNHPQTAYLPGNVLDYDQPAHLICIFLPFVFPEPHVAWGLPKHLFQPEPFFQHVMDTLLVPGGYLVLTNQGEAEFDQQAEYLKLYSLDVKFSGELSQSFLPLKYPRYGWLLKKPTTPGSEVP